MVVVETIKSQKVCSMIAATNFSKKWWLENLTVAKMFFLHSSSTDSRMSDPRDCLQAQLWRSSSRSDGLREVSSHLQPNPNQILRHPVAWTCNIFLTVFLSGFLRCVTAWCTNSWLRGCCTGCCWIRARSSLSSRAPVRAEPQHLRRRRRKTWVSVDWVENSSGSCRTWWVTNDLNMILLRFCHLGWDWPSNKDFQMGIWCFLLPCSVNSATGTFLLCLCVYFFSCPSL